MNPATAPAVVANLGMGVDSVAWWMRVMNEPSFRPCNLEDLIVVTSMTGDEWPETGRLMEEYVLPEFRRHGVRYVQLARRGMKNKDGIIVLSDTRYPKRMFMNGPVSLGRENILAGTIVQSARRACSDKWKGWVIDTFLKETVPGPIIQIMGYEAGEPDRAVRDADRNTARRTGAYPLLDWGWDRHTCEMFIEAQTGVQWPKSACVFCPYAFSLESREATLARYAADPEAGIPALMLEHTALALNYRQGLRGVRREQGRITGALTLRELVEADPRYGHVTELFRRRLDESPWRMYEVRRAYAKAGRAVRSLKTIDTGTRGQMLAGLRREARLTGADLSAHDGIERAWLTRRADTYPAREHLLVAAPEGPVDKAGPGFDDAWAVAAAGDAGTLW